MNRDAIAGYIRFFEALQPASLRQLDQHYAAHARFVDPFNDVSGPAAIRQVFSHMFDTCENPRFKVDECVGGNGIHYLLWTFEFGSEEKAQRITGVSRVRLGDDGRVLEHIDYWDPASQVYEAIPILGSLMRWLRRRLAAPTAGANRNPISADKAAVTERKSHDTGK